jgi:hypothetical protein
MTRLTGTVLEVTVLPTASWTATTGWVTKAVPPVELEGLVVKTSLVVEPTVMEKLALTALLSPAETAVSV